MEVDNFVAFAFNLTFGAFLSLAQAGELSALKTIGRPMSQLHDRRGHEPLTLDIVYTLPFDTPTLNLIPVFLRRRKFITLCTLAGWSLSSETNLHPASLRKRTRSSCHHFIVVLWICCRLYSRSQPQLHTKEPKQCLPNYHQPISRIYGPLSRKNK